MARTPEEKAEYARRYRKENRHRDASRLRQYRIVQKETVPCSFEGCQHGHYAKTLCRGHYYQRYCRNIQLRPLKMRIPKIGTCSFEVCGKSISTGGLCRGHYNQRRVGKALTPLRGYLNKLGPCSFEGCGRQRTDAGFCHTHYEQKRRGKELRPRRIAKGFTNSQGYREVYSDGRWMREHRLFMERHIGRKLFKHENVHHINGQRADNRIENLELWSKSQPCGQRIVDKIQWAKDFLVQYANFDLIGET